MALDLSISKSAAADFWRLMERRLWHRLPLQARLIANALRVEGLDLMASHWDLIAERLEKRAR